LRPGETKYAKEPDKVYNKMYYYLSEFGWDSKESRMWYLTDDITKEEGVTYVFEITYTKAVSKGQTTIRPFLWRKQDNGMQLEVHLPWVGPTSKADKSLFGTKDDKSDPNVKKSNGQMMYYVGESIFPFAFHLEGASVDVFKNTILKRENESKRIDTFFPEFLEWSKSNGETNKDWYLHPSE
jgi:LruC domain-containing protein